MVNHNMHIWNSTTVSHHLLATICELHMSAHCEIRQMLCMTVACIKYGKLDNVEQSSCHNAVMNRPTLLELSLSPYLFHGI